MAGAQLASQRRKGRKQSEGEGTGLGHGSRMGRGSGWAAGRDTGSLVVLSGEGDERCSELEKRNLKPQGGGDKDAGQGNPLPEGKSGAAAGAGGNSLKFPSKQELLPTCGLCS